MGSHSITYAYLLSEYAHGLIRNDYPMKPLTHELPVHFLQFRHIARFRALFRRYALTRFRLRLSGKELRRCPELVSGPIRHSPISYDSNCVFKSSGEWHVSDRVCFHNSRAIFRPAECVCHVVADCVHLNACHTLYPSVYADRLFVIAPLTRAYRMFMSGRYSIRPNHAPMHS